MKINNRKYTSIRCLVSGLALFAVTLANAGINHNLSSIVADGITNGGYSVSDTSLIVQHTTTAAATIGTSADATFWNGVFVFQLPNLGAYSFVAADLSWSGSGTGIRPVMDLYALRASSANQVNGSDFGVTPDSQLLTNIIETGSTGLTNTNLNLWMSSNYTVGNYVYFAFRARSDPGGAGNRYTVGPIITLDIDSQIVPEPTTYALIFGSLTLGFVFIRRRRKA